MAADAAAGQKNGAYTVKFEVKLSPDAAGTESFLVEVRPDWAPLGAKRFKDMMDARYFDGCRFHRAVRGFMTQFGIAGDPALYKRFGSKQFPDDPLKQSNTLGKVSFAHRGPNTRSTQMFINRADNSGLDEQNFPPFAQVVEGMDVVERVFDGYGDYPPRGKGPEPERIKAEGNAYLEAFPKLSFIVSTTIV
eukprot:CAMPEP_0205819446 /NCGR_PEP_ID=MMETSP0206-20130828/1831_1 /ASSEMBLY_ACC=CAM_ASM_000279 /TAXON_ID=36767 /ORGANISM="Euplotes focardii, Strain TN1" /LENGTH=191 /DNA_ID=CAMNT_0053113057 /DNA_START=81 /DNA_END=656 /DNA_ORIENTATION=+